MTSQNIKITGGSVKYFSMFSGVGGFELGIQRAFDIGHEATHRQEATESLQEMVSDNKRNTVQRAVSCVGYSEIDKYAIETYEHNWKGHKNYGDATKIDERGLPDFDLLVGGFPCQAFSIAGKRHGFNETRGTLFFDIARILSHKRPRHLVLENVKGLLSHDSGKTFATIIGVLTDLGYVIEWQVLNAKNFGVPQNRERVFIVGHLGACCGRQIFPIIGNNGQTLKNAGYLNSETWQKRNESIRRVYDPSGIAPTTPTGTGGGVMTKIVAIGQVNNSQSGKVYDPDGLATTIAANGGGMGAKTGLYKVKSVATRTRAYAGKPEALEVRKDDVSNTINSVTKDYMVAVDMTRRKASGHKVRKDGVMGTVTATYYKGIGNAVGSGVKDGTKIRRLTPTECERLMSWPDGWTIGSDTQRYKQCGNGVVSNCVQAVIEALYVA